MNEQRVAEELVMVAKELLVAKKEVPEAFKKQWKNKDKDNDGKENEPKPDFLKKKKASDAIAEELVSIVKELVAKKEVPEAFKEQWKKNDKKEDKKDDDKKDDKKKESSVSVARALVNLAKELVIV